MNKAPFVPAVPRAQGTHWSCPLWRCTGHTMHSYSPPARLLSHELGFVIPVPERKLKPCYSQNMPAMARGMGIPRMYQPGMADLWNNVKSGRMRPEEKQMASLHQKLDLIVHPELLLRSVLEGKTSSHPDLLHPCLVWMHHSVLLPKGSVGTLGKT